MRILKFILLLISISLLILSINANIQPNEEPKTSETPVVQPDQIITTKPNSNNNKKNENEKKLTNSFLTRKQLKYNVVLKNNNNINNNNNNNNNNNDNNNNVNNDSDNQYNNIEMISKDGTKYKCLIPKPVEKVKEEWVEVPTIEKIRDSLSTLKNKCIKSVNPAIWWSYEFCYQDKVRQMHLEKGVVASEFILGAYNNDESDSNGSIKGIDQNILEKYKKKEITEIPSSHSSSSSSAIYLPYFSEIYEGGTDCEILNIKRFTEVRYYCSKDAQQPIFPRYLRAHHHAPIY
ncbi:hypothetical protein DICPUDRAFT_147289 [Dictyostelium purpureum]|uniref:Protein OS9-like domain-containing protein n=1 Tax=Dictyostelium purpureum TaxID=5786 RepID=F0Z844_DICPU|nr:uncharacterized protein DICPUDRAFT_147289 [Dictyostelium purpureum]EGC39865.1 hypothetical protein DICPUDRAFT_147289 [Dictyostelium purpureum]|eukprot:XP_003283616.1 hypothetical protein DICPUDRAFT_147289 [Dictyostelium purpureum]